jgi:hypothetical protein
VVGAQRPGRPLHQRAPARSTRSGRAPDPLLGRAAGPGRHRTGVGRGPANPGSRWRGGRCRGSWYTGMFRAGARRSPPWACTGVLRKRRRRQPSRRCWEGEAGPGRRQLVGVDAGWHRTPTPPGWPSSTARPETPAPGRAVASRCR